MLSRDLLSANRSLHIMDFIVAFLTIPYHVVLYYFFVISIVITVLFLPAQAFAHDW